MKTPEFLKNLLALLFPPRCVLCGELTYGESLCPRCRAGLCLLHSKKSINLPNLGETVSCKVPFAYQDKIRDSILRFKFGGHREYAVFYGEMLAQEIKENGPEISFDLITAVPISQKRRRGRGYNQSELIAREAARRLGFPYAETLEKVKDNREQHRLDKKDRRKNVRGVYRALPKASLQGKRVLLVDDIVTTGATLAECAETLLVCGAGQVLCAAVAEVLIS